MRNESADKSWCSVGSVPMCIDWIYKNFGRKKYQLFDLIICYNFSSIELELVN